MESKYKGKAIEVIESNPMFDGYCAAFHVDTVPDFIIKAMCQLAEEVEKTQFNLGLNIGSQANESYAKQDNFYSKKQIEEAITICTDKDYEAWILVESFREILYKGIVNKETLKIN